MVRVLVIMRAVLPGMFMLMGVPPLLVCVRVAMLMAVLVDMGVLVLMAVPLAVMIVRMLMSMSMFMGVLMQMVMIPLHGFFLLSSSPRSCNLS